MLLCTKDGAEVQHGSCKSARVLLVKLRGNEF